MSRAIKKQNIVDLDSIFDRTLVKLFPIRTAYHAHTWALYTRRAKVSIYEHAIRAVLSVTDKRFARRLARIARSPFSHRRDAPTLPCTSVCRVSSENYAQLARIAPGRISARRSAAMQLQRPRDGSWRGGGIELTRVPIEFILTFKKSLTSTISSDSRTLLGDRLLSRCVLSCDIVLLLISIRFVHAFHPIVITLSTIPPTFD